MRTERIELPSGRACAGLIELTPKSVTNGVAASFDAVATTNDISW